MKQLDDDMHVLCLSDESTAQFTKELCQVLLEDVDVLANSIIGESVSKRKVSCVIDQVGTGRRQHQFQLARVLWPGEPLAEASSHCPVIGGTRKVLTRPENDRTWRTGSVLAVVMQRNVAPGLTSLLSWTLNATV